MTSRDRFQAVMRFETPDRVPYFEEGIRDSVIDVWRRQGLSGRGELNRLFPSDVRERLELNVKPQPDLTKWPARPQELDYLHKSLNPDDQNRLPAQWKKRVRQWKDRRHVLMLRVNRGFFQSMGVMNWPRFREVMTLLVDQPNLVRDIMAIQGRFCARLMARVLGEVRIDAAIFSEPIGGNEGPLISPQMYEDVVLKSYQPILDVLKQHHVDCIIFQTYANARILIPCILKWGFNTLWACEVYTKAMDYGGIRRTFGRDVKLIGGIDLDALRSSKTQIKKEIQTKVPPLIDQGGYIPLADGRVREDVSFENYCYYRKLLQEVIEKG
jgi:uroporphyrinogen-III decarboxylase